MSRVGIETGASGVGPRGATDNVLSPTRSSQESKLRSNNLHDQGRLSTTYTRNELVEESVIEERKKTQTSSSIVRSNLMSLEQSDRRAGSPKPMVLEVIPPENTSSPMQQKSDRLNVGYPQVSAAGGVAQQGTDSNTMKKSFRNIPGVTEREAEKYAREKEKSMAKSQRDILAIQKIAEELTQEKGNIIEKLEEAKSSRTIALMKKADNPPPAAYPRPNFADPTAQPNDQPMHPREKLHPQLSLSVMRDNDSPLKGRGFSEVNRVATLTNSIVLPMEDSSPLIIPKDRRLPARSNTFEIGLNRLPEGDSPHHKAPQYSEIKSTLVQSIVHEESKVQEKSYAVDSSSRPLMGSPVNVHKQDQQVTVSGFSSPPANINLINQPVTVNIRGGNSSNMTAGMQASQSMNSFLPNPGQIMWPTSVAGSKIMQANASAQARHDLKQEMASNTTGMYLERESQLGMLKSSSTGFYSEAAGKTFLDHLHQVTANRAVEFILQTVSNGSLRLNSSEASHPRELCVANWTKWFRLLEILHTQQPTSGWDKIVSVDVDDMLTSITRELNSLRTQLSETKVKNETLQKERDILERRLAGEAQLRLQASRHPHEQGFIPSHLSTFGAHSAIRSGQRMQSPGLLARGTAGLESGPISSNNKNYYFSLQANGPQGSFGGHGIGEGHYQAEGNYQTSSNYVQSSQLGLQSNGYAGRAASNSVTESTAHNLLRRNYSSYLNPADRLNIASMVKKGQLGVNPHFTKSNAVLYRPEHMFLRNNSASQRPVYEGQSRMVTTESEEEGQRMDQPTTHFIYEIHNGKHQLRRNQSIKDRTIDCCDQNHTGHDHEGNRSQVHVRNDLSTVHTPHRQVGYASTTARSPEPHNGDGESRNHHTHLEEAVSQSRIETVTQTEPKVMLQSTKPGKQLGSPTGSAAGKAGVSAVFARLSNLASNPGAGRRATQLTESGSKQVVSSLTSGGKLDKPLGSTIMQMSHSRGLIKSTKLQSNQHLFAAMAKDVSGQKKTSTTGTSQVSSRGGEGAVQPSTNQDTHV